MTEKIKISFPGMSIGQDGSIIPTKDFLKQRRQFKKNLQEQAGLQNLFKSRKSILKTGENDISKERKKTTFGTVQDLLQEFNKTPQSNSEIRLPTITPHVAGFKEILSHQLPVINIKREKQPPEDPIEKAKKFILNTKTIHDKYNIAIRVDMNWGKSSKKNSIFNKIRTKTRNKPPANIEFRKLNKTVQDAVNEDSSLIYSNSSKTKERVRVASQSNFTGIRIGIKRQLDFTCKCPPNENYSIDRLYKKILPEEKKERKPKPKLRKGVDRTPPLDVSNPYVSSN